MVPGTQHTNILNNQTPHVILVTGVFFMGRGHRIEYEGAIYHVVQRGNNREYIFEREQDKLFLLSQLNEASELH